MTGMSLGDLFTLAKLTIDAYASSDREGSPRATFVAQYNPETLSIRHESVYLGDGATPTAEFSHSRPQRLSVNLVLDGTKVGYMGVELLGNVPTVADQIEKFLSVCYQIEGPIHQPLYLKLRWGQAIGGFVAVDKMRDPVFRCRLESVEINYKAFDRYGAPLHAELAAVFLENLDPVKDAAQKDKQSPDLTHRWVVVDGDSLPLLCREIYGSPVHYLRIAQVNGLDDFRDLTPGQELIFPPFERTRKG